MKNCSARVVRWNVKIVSSIFKGLWERPENGSLFPSAFHKQPDFDGLLGRALSPELLSGGKLHLIGVCAFRRLCGRRSL